MPRWGTFLVPVSPFHVEWLVANDLVTCNDASSAVLCDGGKGPQTIFKGMTALLHHVEAYWLGTGVLCADRIHP